MIHFYLWYKFLFDIICYDLGSSYFYYMYIFILSFSRWCCLFNIPFQSSDIFLTRIFIQGLFIFCSSLISMFKSSSYSSSGKASVTLKHAHFWVVVFHPRTAAKRSLVSVSLIMLVHYFIPPPSIPARRHSRGIPSSSPIHSSLYECAAAAATFFFVPSKSRLACSRHRQDTLTPGLRGDGSQSSSSGRVAI